MEVAHYLTATGGIRSYWVKICIFHLVYLLKARMNLKIVQRDLLKWTRRTLKIIESFFILFLKYGRKMPVEQQHF